jgi:hypothetical protein
LNELDFTDTMASYKAPGFEERTALAQRAKQQVLDRLRAKPAVDPDIIAARIAREEERKAAAAEARRVREEEREQARAAKAVAAEAAAAEAAAAAAAAAPKPRDEAAEKAARDARYAARKRRAS